MYHYLLKYLSIIGHEVSFLTTVITTMVLRFFHLYAGFLDKGSKCAVTVYEPQ